MHSIIPARVISQVSDFMKSIEHHPESLFHSEPTQTGEVNHPLGHLSWSATHLPYLVDKLGSGSALAEFVEAQLSTASTWHLVEAAQRSRLAEADIFWLRAGIVHNQGIPGPKLSFLSDKVATEIGRPNGHTYDDLILGQDYSDLRLFTSGELGKSERDFYIGHLICERVLGHVAAAIIRAKTLILERRLHTAADVLRDGSLGLNRAVDVMHTMRTELDPRHFNNFRVFFMKDPLSGVPGASGLYSGSFPFIDLLIHGTDLPQSHLSRIRNDLWLYPAPYKDLIKQYFRENHKEGSSLIRLYLSAGSPKQLAPSIERILDYFTAHRKAHIAAVKHQLPEVFAGKKRGTSGDVNSIAVLSSAYGTSAKAKSQLKL